MPKHPGGRRLSLWVQPRDGGKVAVSISGDFSAEFYYENPQDVEKIEQLLMEYIRKNQRYFPYTKAKSEAAKGKQWTRCLATVGS